jgi:hypothetical protein
MGALTPFLQQEFSRQCPPGWRCRREVRVIPTQLEQILGYGARVDVLLERRDESRRLWIEFEVSRSDPVANHAKFATAHIFQPQTHSDSFVAMVSPHVVRGRRNLSANTIHLMRLIGMNAFHTVLLPQLSPQSIKDLNHANYDVISASNLDIDAEIERVMSVTEPVLSTPTSTIHFCGDLLEVILNVRQWNRDMQIEHARDVWGKRTIMYFVFDPVSKDFAPAKFCAYIPVYQDQRPPDYYSSGHSMTIELYTATEFRSMTLDGYRARHHLTKRLLMQEQRYTAAATISNKFNQWISRHENYISVRANEPVMLVPPSWFR